MSDYHLISRLRSIDWDFEGTPSESSFSAIHWHPARFVSQIPAALIGVLSKPSDVVLDPFAGSGTTLVEAQRLGRVSIGIDLNPVSAAIMRAKILRVSAATIRRHTQAIASSAKRALRMRRPARTVGLESCVPPGVQESKWYTPEVRDELAALWHTVGTLTGPARILGRAAFSAILLGVCRERRHWGYVCDNSEPKGSDGGDVLAAFCTTLSRFDQAYDSRDAELRMRNGRLHPIAPARVLCGDAHQQLLSIGDSSADLVVTSPPYFGVVDYTKAQRLTTEWFGVEIEPLRRIEIGARSKRHRKQAAEEYIADLRCVFRQIRRCLRTSGYCAVVIGESKLRTTILQEAHKSIEECGFSVRLDLNRTVSSQRRQTPSILGEHLILLQATGDLY